MLQYGLHVYRATSRSPNFYLSSISSFGMSSGATLSKLGQLVQQPPPFDESRAREILEHMRNIPRILEQAKQNLTYPTQEMSRWALPTLLHARRNSRNFATALAAHFPPARAAELHAAAAAMGSALEDYRSWIEERLPTMARAQPIGRDMYDWILRRIWLLPYDATEILHIAEQEYARYLSFTSFEEARNRGLPTPARAKTTAEYAANTEADAERIRAFLSAKDVLTIPDYVRAVSTDPDARISSGVFAVGGVERLLDAGKRSREILGARGSPLYEHLLGICHACRCKHEYLS